MKFLSLLLLGSLAIANPVEELTLKFKAQPSLNATFENYWTACKTCPYNLCTNVKVPQDDTETVTCWTSGERIDDTNLWLKSVDGCYIPEYDFIEYPGDYREDLEYCGNIPFEITRQPATVRYLSECKWDYRTSGESIRFYGRDEDVVLTCWAEGGKIMDNSYWYKTTDNCHVSGSGLWAEPDRSRLDNCGPSTPNRANETLLAIEGDKPHPARQIKHQKTKKDLSPRWLQPEKVGEEYAPCYTCPTYITNSTCTIRTVYEYNQTVVHQCIGGDETRTVNGTSKTSKWMLTTDWCYVDGYDFWSPPWDYFRYPRCHLWTPEQIGI